MYKRGDIVPCYCRREVKHKQHGSATLYIKGTSIPVFILEEQDVSFVADRRYEIKITGASEFGYLGELVQEPIRIPSIIHI